MNVRSRATIELSLNDISVRGMKIEDVREAVDVHLHSFPDFFLSSLGSRFLYWLYRGFIEHRGGVCLVALKGEQVVGVVAGSSDQGKFFKWLLRKHWFVLGLAAGMAIVRSPRIMARLLRITRSPGDAKRSIVPAVLMSIAVLPVVQGGGVGQILVKAFLDEMTKRGATTVSLTTDRDNNSRVNSFYRRLGFRLHRELLTPEGRQMNEYVIESE